MSHRIACSLCPHCLPEGRGVTLVRNFVVFHFCWHCYRMRRAECERFMDAQSTAPQKQTLVSRQLQRTAGAMVTVLVVALGLLSADGCAGAEKRPRRLPPTTYRHATVVHEGDGRASLGCPNPLQVWDAKLKRKVIYCDGKVKQ